MMSLHTTIITLKYTDILLSSDVIILAITGVETESLGTSASHNRGVYRTCGMVISRGR
jgi:hypothetical protein